MKNTDNKIIPLSIIVAFVASCFLWSSTALANPIETENNITPDCGLALGDTARMRTEGCFVPGWENLIGFGNYDDGTRDTSPYAFPISISNANVGDITLKFRDSPANLDANDQNNIEVSIFRLGYYGGAGARLKKFIDSDSAEISIPAGANESGDEMGCDKRTVQPAAGLPSENLSNRRFFYYECLNWQNEVKFAVTDWVPGLYAANFHLADETTDRSKDYTTFFIIRDDDTGIEDDAPQTPDIVFQIADTTWHAYNSFPPRVGASLYPFSRYNTDPILMPSTHVSYHRPFITESKSNSGFNNAAVEIFRSDYPMIRFLEEHGYNVKYVSSRDLEKGVLTEPENHTPKLYLSVGHDEYFSQSQRDALGNAGDSSSGAFGNGTNLAWFSGNTMFWRIIRDYTTRDGSSLPSDIIVSYKDEAIKFENGSIAVVHPTGNWGVMGSGEVESSTTGLMTGHFTINESVEIPPKIFESRFWQQGNSTDVINTLGPETLSIEFDSRINNNKDGIIFAPLSDTNVASEGSGLEIGWTISNHAMVLGSQIHGWNRRFIFNAGTMTLPLVLGYGSDPCPSPVPNNWPAIEGAAAEISTTSIDYCSARAKARDSIKYLFDELTSELEFAVEDPASTLDPPALILDPAPLITDITKLNNLVVGHDGKIEVTSWIDTTYFGNARVAAGEWRLKTGETTVPHNYWRPLIEFDDETMDTVFKIQKWRATIPLCSSFNIGTQDVFIEARVVNDLGNPSPDFGPKSLPLSADNPVNFVKNGTFECGLKFTQPHPGLAIDWEVFGSADSIYSSPLNQRPLFSDVGRGKQRIQVGPSGSLYGIQQNIGTLDEGTYKVSARVLPFYGSVGFFLTCGGDVNGSTVVLGSEQNGSSPDVTDGRYNKWIDTDFNSVVGTAGCTNATVIIYGAKNSTGEGDFKVDDVKVEKAPPPPP